MGRFILIFVVILVLLFFGIGISNPVREKEISSTNTETLKHKIEDIISTGEMRTTFVEACEVEPNSSRLFCTCSFDFLLEKHGKTKLLKIAEEANGETPVEFFEAALYCYDHLK